MKRAILILFVVGSILWAQECSHKLFNLKAMGYDGGGITIKDILKDLTHSCEVSVVFDDRSARAAINKPLDFVNIKNYTFEELLDFILGENDLFYRYDDRRKILHVAKYRTQSFNLDYINLSFMVSESKKSVVLGTSSDTTTGAYGMRGSTTGTTGGTYTSNGRSNDYTTITTKSEFTFWNNLQKQLEALLGGVSGKKDYEIFINKDASLVTVRGTKRELEAVKRFLDRLLDRIHKQVLIEAKLIELVYNDSQNIGVDWSQFNLSITGSREAHSLRQDGVEMSNFALPNYFIGYHFSMDGLFDFLKRYGDVKVLSNPKILTLNNQPAIINVGDQINYRYETSGYTTATTSGVPVQSATYAIGQSFVGITLYVIPEITEDGQIIMKINPVTSELLNEEQNLSYMRTLPPDLKIKQLTSIVKVKDGQKILIGGLISKKIKNEEKKVPIVGDLPVIGRLFHNTKKDIKKSELFILISPKIIKEHNIPTIDQLPEFEE
ncbi:MAG: pilus (MSHA type) biogenesis protein MshL [Epsilonproteobacteria bacterium]|nr:pilus (MSHA type) biogenesis protein MshL [Campylobacterota bacterium]NPA63850.1 pilus (MSHA type) biogenesis protein MshL [Campylobacterota bacterium]